MRELLNKSNMHGSIISDDKRLDSVAGAMINIKHVMI